MRTNRARQNPCIMEEMESRTLLSAAPAPQLFNPIVKADRLQIQADLLHFKSDCFSFSATLLKDVTAIKSDDPAQATTVTPLIAQMKTDINAMRTTLKQDRLQESANALADESVITLDLLQLSKDKGNPTAVAADRTKLRADRIQLQTDLIAGLNARITTRQTSFAAIVADGDAINTAASTDPNASVQLQKDLLTWTTDRTNRMTTLTADLQTIVIDRTQLVTDLTALQNA